MKSNFWPFIDKLPPHIENTAQLGSMPVFTKLPGLGKLTGVGSEKVTFS